MVLFAFILTVGILAIVLFSLLYGRIIVVYASTCDYLARFIISIIFRLPHSKAKVASLILLNPFFMSEDYKPLNLKSTLVKAFLP